MATLNEMRDKFDKMSIADKEQFIQKSQEQIKGRGSDLQKRFLNECIDEYEKANKNPRRVRFEREDVDGILQLTSDDDDSSQNYRNEGPARSSLKKRLILFFSTFFGLGAAVLVLVLVFGNSPATRRSTPPANTNIATPAPASVGTTAPASPGEVSSSTKGTNSNAPAGYSTFRMPFFGVEIDYPSWLTYERTDRDPGNDLRVFYFTDPGWASDEQEPHIMFMCDYGGIQLLQLAGKEYSRDLEKSIATWEEMIENFELADSSESNNSHWFTFRGSIEDSESLNFTPTASFFCNYSNFGDFATSSGVFPVIISVVAPIAYEEQYTEIFMTIIDSLRYTRDEPGGDSNTGADANLRSFTDKLYETNDWVWLEVHWENETITTFERSDLRWTMYSRTGDTSEVFPAFSRSGTTIEIRFPTTSRVYYLYDDYTGIFGEERFTWSYSHKDRDSIVENGGVEQPAPSVTQPSPSDTQPTPTYAQSAPSDSIVGRWEGRDEFNMVMVYEFKSDNSYTMTKAYSGEVGTYEIVGNKLNITQILGVIIVETGKNMTYTYTRTVRFAGGALYLDDDRFEWAPLVPPPTPPQKMSDDDYYDILIEIRRLESLLFSNDDHASDFFRYASICLLACKLVDDYRPFPIMQARLNGYYYDETNAAKYGHMALNRAVLWKTWWNDGDTISPIIRVPKYDKQEIILFLSLLPSGVRDYVWSEYYSFLIE